MEMNIGAEEYSFSLTKSPISKLDALLPRSLQKLLDRTLGEAQRSDLRHEPVLPDCSAVLLVVSHPRLGDEAEIVHNPYRIVFWLHFGRFLTTPP